MNLFLVVVLCLLIEKKINRISILFESIFKNASAIKQNSYAVKNLTWEILDHWNTFSFSFHDGIIDEMLIHYINISKLYHSTCLKSFCNWIFASVLKMTIINTATKKNRKNHDKVNSFWSHKENSFPNSRAIHNKNVKWLYIFYADIITQVKIVKKYLSIK